MRTELSCPRRPSLRFSIRPLCATVHRQATRLDAPSSGVRVWSWTRGVFMPLSSTGKGPVTGNSDDGEVRQQHTRARGELMLPLPAIRSDNPPTIRDWVKKFDAYLLWAFNPDPHLRSKR